MTDWMQLESTMLAAAGSVPALGAAPSALVNAAMSFPSAFPRQAVNVGSGFDPPVGRPFPVAFAQHPVLAAPSLPAALSFAAEHFAGARVHVSPLGQSLSCEQAWVVVAL